MDEKFIKKEVKEKILEEIKNGASLKDLVSKYGVSAYYIRKWAKIVYKDMDLNHYVRFRYKWIVLNHRDKIVNDMADIMTKKEVESISDETWDEWQDIIRKGMYEMLKDTIQAI